MCAILSHSDCANLLCSNRKGLYFYKDPYIVCLQNISLPAVTCIETMELNLNAHMIFFKGVTLVSGRNFGRYQSQNIKFKNKYYMSFKRSSVFSENSKRSCLDFLPLKEVQ